MKVVPTTYNGINYRSRTEARWAVVFDELHWQHYYEMEAFDLPCGKYLPDFYLPQFRTFFEVKGREPNETECAKAEALCLHTGCTVLISSGPPNPHRGIFDEDILTFVFVGDKYDPFVDVNRGGFVNGRKDNHPACSLHLGNLWYLETNREVPWETVFLSAANNRFGIYA